MHTMKVLMKLLAINFHYMRLVQVYKESFEQEPVMTITLAMNRCIRLYQAAGQLDIVFKLLARVSNDERANVTKRLLIAIKVLVTEHTLFPVKFVFGGVDLLDALQNNNNLLK